MILSKMFQQIKSPFNIHVQQFSSCTILKIKQTVKKRKTIKTANKHNKKHATAFAEKMLSWSQAAAVIPGS